MTDSPLQHQAQDAEGLRAAIAQCLELGFCSVCSRPCDKDSNCTPIDCPQRYCRWREPTRDEQIDRISGILAASPPQAETPGLDREAVEPISYHWNKGLPPKPWCEDWFIARLVSGDRVVIRSLPEEYSYDFTTADGTYLKSATVKSWMQLPDGGYVPFCPPREAAEAVEAIKSIAPEISDPVSRAQFNLQVRKLSTILAATAVSQPPTSRQGADDVEALRDAARFRALMRCGRIKPQGSAGVNPITGARIYSNEPGVVHFGAEFWVQPEPETSAATVWGRHCLRALADDILAYEAATGTVLPAQPGPAPVGEGGAIEAARSTLNEVKAWIDSDLPAGTPRAGAIHALVYKTRAALDSIPAAGGADYHCDRAVAALAARATTDADLAKARDEIAGLTTPRPLDEYHEDYGFVLWWILPVCEPPYSGSPNCDDWPGYHTHWTPLPEISAALTHGGDRGEIDRETLVVLPDHEDLDRLTVKIAREHGCDRGTFSVCWGEIEQGLTCRCKEDARALLTSEPAHAR